MFEENLEKESKQDNQQSKEQLKYLVIIGLVGIGYYFFFFLPEQRSDAKKEITEFFKENSPVTATDLDANLWKGFKSWQERLDKLYLPSQISRFSEEMMEAIETRKKEMEEKKFRSVKEAKEKGVIELENYCSENEKQLPEFKKIIEKYSKKINNSDGRNISGIQKEAEGLIIEERVKRQGLHWRRTKQEKKSWADKWLVDNIQSFENAWSKMTEIMGKEPEHFNIAASYTIKFPPSLWNDLTNEEKRHKKTEELKLGDDVPTYKFGTLIEKWERKTKTNPIRGERDPNTKLDNNALFYGAPRTGKSVMAEKLAYEADKYPLVVIQGSSLTPRKIDYDAGINPLGKFIFTLCDIDYTLTDDFNFRRETNGEVRYILFIDEANQITTSTLLSKSTELTFLKECMGSDNRINESKNLWIAATNHLDQINPAVYQPGRLSNPLDFSWTLGDFMNYASEAGIVNNFPKRWLDTVTLGDEDNKWVNRFNKMYFDNDFLPFWNKFINTNSNAEYEPEKEEEEPSSYQENNKEKENKNKKIKIKWGEMFEFFWRLFDSKQLDHFNGKFTNPRQPKIEQVVENNMILVGNQISKSINTRLKELTETAETIKNNSRYDINNCTSAIEIGLENIRLLISEVGKNL